MTIADDLTVLNHEIHEHLLEAGYLHVHVPADWFMFRRTGMMKLIRLGMISLTNTSLQKTTS